MVYNSRGEVAVVVLVVVIVVDRPSSAPYDDSICDVQGASSCTTHGTGHSFQSTKDTQVHLFSENKKQSRWKLPNQDLHVRGTSLFRVRIPSPLCIGNLCI